MLGKELNPIEGNTPTAVGKTQRLKHSPFVCKKHPHSRGEDSQQVVDLNGYMETPPQPWGRPAQEVILTSVVRNTPTAVGKTGLASNSIHWAQKHPHSRGEDR